MLIADGRSEFRAGWPVVLACFAMAVFAWGFGFYGQSVFLAELQRLHGWSSGLISFSMTTYYLLGAALLSQVHVAISRFGPRHVLISGVLFLACGAIANSQADAPWMLFAGGLLMAVGWASTSSTAIATSLALWFDLRRGLAISLALNGASVAGFTVAPALVHLSQSIGFRSAVLLMATGMSLILIPLILIALRGGSTSGGDFRRISADEAMLDARPAFVRQKDALADTRFWSVAFPFALGISAQVGFIVHEVAFLLPFLGPSGAGLAIAATSGAAVIGRVGLGIVIDRLDQRLASAVTFASQAAALVVMLCWRDPLALYAASIVFGLSVGNVITLPALIVQREFAARSFGLVLGLCTAIGQFAYAFGPGLLGLVHDAAGGYAPALGVCIILQLAAAVLLLRRPAVSRRTADQAV